MNGEQQTSIANLVLDVIMIMSVFFAGVFIEEFGVMLSSALLIMGVFLSQIRAVESKEREKE